MREAARALSPTSVENLSLAVRPSPILGHLNPTILVSDGSEITLGGFEHVTQLRDSKNHSITMGVSSQAVASYYCCNDFIIGRVRVEPNNMWPSQLRQLTTTATRMVHTKQAVNTLATPFLFVVLQFSRSVLILHLFVFSSSSVHERHHQRPGCSLVRSMSNFAVS